MAVQRVAIGVEEGQGIARQSWPCTRGVPLPAGAVKVIDEFWLEDDDGLAAAAQFRLLSRWPDGSVKWVLVDFQANVAARETVRYQLCWGGEKGAVDGVPTLSVDEEDERITVCTGPLRFSVSRRRFGLFESVEMGRVDESGAFECARKLVPADIEESPSARPVGNEAWVRICESFFDGDSNRRTYGMGGDCLASLARDVYRAEVEEAGLLRVVIRCDGAFEAAVPMHHYRGYQPLKFTLRIYAYAGQDFVRVLHTVTVACNPRETEVEEIAVRVGAGLQDPLRCRIGLRGEEERSLAGGETLVLSQRLDNHFRLERSEGLHKRALAEGERAEGWMTVEDEGAGVGVALRHMAAEYPKALAADGDGGGIEVYLWRDPDGGRLNFKRYAEEMAWDEGEGVYSDGTGTAKTSEFFVSFYPAESSDDAPDRLRGLLHGPHVALEPAWMAQCQVTGGFAPRDESAFPESEQMMREFAAWAGRNIELGRWYGFFDWGDMLVAWEAEAETWRFRGRWGWCNSEWDPRHGLWIQYLRTGEPDLLQLGEAMTRHSVDVDTCHYHPFRPYMVGGCFRHSVDHFGDEPCASHTFLDNWVDYYYLTGDLRTLEVLRSAGEFFRRYSWTEDPAYSFSLRSIANTLRGLLYVYEVTGEEQYMRRAEEVYEVIARGQNEDGSWHKRFQVSTADRLSDQGPYGMATEGTTLAVEMGTAQPFSDGEHRKLRGETAPLIRVLPLAEQKGYQTHYLMIGLELMHRLTGRQDVALVYRRAVDWFCGYPDELNAAKAIQENYGGVICRHLGYAFRLTGERRYLQIGQAVLRHLIDLQDRSDDPRRRGSVGLSPMYLSLHFFGVPYLLGALGDAGMGERNTDLVPGS